MIRLTRESIVENYIKNTMQSKKGLWFVAYDLRESNVDTEKFNEILGKRFGAPEIPFKDCQIILLRLNEKFYDVDGLCKSIYQKFRKVHVDVEFYKDGTLLDVKPKPVDKVSTVISYHQPVDGDLQFSLPYERDCKMSVFINDKLFYELPPTCANFNFNHRVCKDSLVEIRKTVTVYE